MTKEEFITKIEDLGFTVPKLRDHKEADSAYYLYDDNTFITLWFGDCRGIMISKLESSRSRRNISLLCAPSWHLVKSVVDFTQCDSNGECKIFKPADFPGWNTIDQGRDKNYFEPMLTFLMY